MKGLKSTSNGFRTLRKYVSGTISMKEAQKAVRQAKLEASLQEETAQKEALALLQEIVDQSPVMKTLPERLRNKLIPKELPFITPLPEGSVVFLYDGEKNHVLGKSVGD